VDWCGGGWVVLVWGQFARWVSVAVGSGGGSGCRKWEEGETEAATGDRRK
jgi:hypothetical protein